jgi:hypothetical protein
VRISSNKDNGKVASSTTINRGYGVVDAPPEAVFELLKGTAGKADWDPLCEDFHVVENIAYNCDVVYYVQKLSTISNLVSDRDFVNLRSCIRNAFGFNTYVIIEHGVEREDVPPVMGK